ncbi:hypothetical protein FE393_09915 [Xenorhabdus sp. psl]|nr:hypothetical protein [Xenorhabdus sp. psl]
MINIKETGEVWGGSVLRYFLAPEENINQFPGFEQELQGIYLQKEKNGQTRIYGYVIDSQNFANLKSNNVKNDECNG